MSIHFSTVEFVEITVDPLEKGTLQRRLSAAGFARIAALVNGDLSWWARPGLNLLLNSDPSGYAHEFRERQGIGPVSIGLRVDDVHAAWRTSIDAGAWPVGHYIRPDLPFPALFGPDDVLVYFTGSLESEKELKWKQISEPPPNRAGFLSLQVADEPARREWDFWLGEVIGLQGFGQPRGGFSGSSSFRIGSRSADEGVQIGFASNSAIRGLSYLEEVAHAGEQIRLPDTDTTPIIDSIGPEPRQSIR